MLSDHGGSCKELNQDIRNKLRIPIRALFNEKIEKTVAIWIHSENVIAAINFLYLSSKNFKKYTLVRKMSNFGMI